MKTSAQNVETNQIPTVIPEGVMNLFNASPGTDDHGGARLVNHPVMNDLSAFGRRAVLAWIEGYFTDVADSSVYTMVEGDSETVDSPARALQGESSPYQNVFFTLLSKLATGGLIALGAFRTFHIYTMNAVASLRDSQPAEKDPLGLLSHLIIS